MEDYIFLATIGVAILVVIFFLKRFFKTDDDKKLPYRKIGDEDAQKEYEEFYEPKALFTKSEKMELSWEFLYEITEHVMNKLPQKDLELIHKLGHQMLESGAGYDHVVEYGIKKEKQKSAAKDKKQEKAIEKSL